MRHLDDGVAVITGTGRTLTLHLAPAGCQKVVTAVARSRRAR